MTSLLLLFLFFLIRTLNCEQVNYEDHKLYEFIPKSDKEIQLLQCLTSVFNEFDYDIWMLSQIIDQPAHIKISPNILNQTNQFLKENSLQFKVIHENLESSFANERLQQQKISKSVLKLDFLKYHRFNDINMIIQGLANNYPNLVTVKQIGTSYQGRPMKTITVSQPNISKVKKNSIFIDAGIHAREWIAPATALYVIHQLVENFNENQEILNHFDIIILPVLNPDGYEYSHTKNRLWRKTRKPNNLLCCGTDGNRNFDFHWGEIGASTDPCSEIYRGKKGFSEPETFALKTTLEKIKKECKFYLTLHSYGQYLLYPWGYTSNLPDNWRDIHDIAQSGYEAIKNATGTKYTVGSSTNVLYAAAGGSDDYALGVTGIPISITMELPGGGSTGFDPPASDIKKSVHESWIGIKAMILKAATKY